MSVLAAALNPKSPSFVKKLEFSQEVVRQINCFMNKTTQSNKGELLVTLHVADNHFYCQMSVTIAKTAERQKFQFICLHGKYELVIMDEGVFTWNLSQLILNSNFF